MGPGVAKMTVSEPIHELPIVGAVQSAQCPWQPPSSLLLPSSASTIDAAAMSDRYEAIG